MTTANLTKVIVPCRLSYAHLWEPDSINGSEPKYSVSCIIDKNDKETIWLSVYCSNRPDCRCRSFHSSIQVIHSNVMVDCVGLWSGRCFARVEMVLRQECKSFPK